MHIIIPGLHNSNDQHWQTRFEHSNPSKFHRVEQENWDELECKTWINRIEEELIQFDHSELILIGHTIGCMAIVHWFNKYHHPIKGALFVAPSDAEDENYPNYIKGFAPIPLTPLPIPTIVVGSTNDHVTTLGRTKQFAEAWGSKLIVLENAGLIEPKSGFGEWEEGLELLKKLENG